MDQAYDTMCWYAYLLPIGHIVIPNDIYHIPHSQHVETRVSPQWHSFVIDKARIFMFEGYNMVVNTLVYQ